MEFLSKTPFCLFSCKYGKLLLTVVVSVISFAVQAKSPWINDNPEYVKGRFGDGLKFNFWRSRLFLKTPGLMSAKEGTIQFWMSPCRDLDAVETWTNIIGSGTSKRQETKFATFGLLFVPPHKAGGKSRLLAYLRSRNKGSVSLRPFAWNKGKWYAVALTWNPNGMAMYINGKLAASKKGPVSFDEVPEYLSFGGGTCKRYGSYADCVLDEIEVSDCVRPESYIKTFAERKNAPVPDKNTAALHHCDKNSGGYSKMTSYYRSENCPSAVWISGFFNDYGTFKYGSKPSIPFSLVNPTDKPVEFKVSVQIKDFKGRPCGKKSKIFKILPGNIEEKRIVQNISKPGWYSYQINIKTELKNIMNETHSFVILPKIPALAMNASNYFGNHLVKTRKTDFFTQAGIPWERTSFFWKEIQPERGVWDWRAGDFMVNAAKKNGIKILAILGHPATWAGKNKISRNNKKLKTHGLMPKDLNAFAEYVYKTVSRYKDHVKYWEIVNEPDWQFADPGQAKKKELSGTNADYLKLLKTAYEAAKKADPNCVIVSGGFVPFSHLITYLKKNGGTKYFDILGMHRYRSWGDLTKYAKMIEKPAWQTEHLVGTPVEATNDSFNGLKASFDKCFFQDANTSCMTHFSTGSFEAYGWEPQPVYFAMANMSAKIGGKEKSGKVTLNRLNNLIDCFLFNKGKKDQVLAVNFNYSGSDKLKISFIPSADGIIKTTGLMGNEMIFNGKKGKPLTVSVENTLFLEGPIDSNSLQVASFDKKEILQNADFKLLEGDIGMDKLKGMRPKGWHLEKEKGNIGMTRLKDDSYAIMFKNLSGSRHIRISQIVQFADPGHYTLTADIMSREGSPVAFMSLWNMATRRSIDRKYWTKLPANQWETCTFDFRLTEPHEIAVIIGLAKGKGELLLRNLRLCKSIDPSIRKNTVFIDIKPYANQSFVDKTANDGKGVWADLGSSDLSLMQTGLRDFSTELFKIATSGNACIMLGKGGKAKLPLEVKGIKVNASLKKLNFLCTALYVKAKPGKSIGTCVVNYTDGSSKEIPFIRGKSIDDWFPPAIGKDVRIAENVRLTGDGQRATFIANWNNPFPNKEIKTLTLKSDNNAIWATIAISGIKKPKNLLKTRGFGKNAGWKVWVSPKARKVNAAVKLGQTALVTSPSEKMHSSNIQLTNPVFLTAGTYFLKMTIDSDSDGKLSGTYSLAKAPYSSYCYFSISVKKGKHSYLTTLRILPKKQKNPDEKCVLRLCPGNFKNANIELSEISIVE